MNILITGAGSVMGQSIYKALAYGNYGGSLKVHFANSEPIGAGRFFNNLEVPVVKTPIFPLARDDEYSKFLENYVNENEIDLVFSGTQHELEKISAFRDQTGKAATLNSEFSELCLDKVRTSNVLAQHDILVPKTLTLLEYLEEGNLEGPVIIKPNHSSSSREIYSAKNFDDAVNLVNSKIVDIDKFLVQGLLVGEEFTCGCYMDKFIEDIQTITFKRTLTQDGATLYGEIISDPVIDAYLIDICRILRRQGLDFGHINVQLILTKTGPCLFEINGRLSSTEASKARFGFNSCEAFVHNIVLGKPYQGWDIRESGKFIRYYEEIYF